MADTQPRVLVLDAWPVLEWLKHKEPASSAFDELLLQAESEAVRFVMCRLNFGEIVYTIRKGPHWPEKEKQRALAVISHLPIELISVSDRLVDAAVDLKSRYRISYADAFAVALSREQRSPLVTGDHEIRLLEEDQLLGLHWVGA